MQAITEVYYSNTGERVGPIQPEQFFQLIDQGIVHPQTHVWDAATQQWSPYSSHLRLQEMKHLRDNGIVAKNPAEQREIDIATGNAIDLQLDNGETLRARFCFDEKLVKAFTRAGIPPADVPEFFLKGGSVVQYQWALSIIILTFKRGSDYEIIKAGESRIARGLKYSLFTLFAGWWGFPFGPIFSIYTIVFNFFGGQEISNLIMVTADSEALGEYEKNRLGKAALVTGGIFLLPILLAIGFAVFGS